ncbi:MAG TPA: transporter [Clostridiales bacterium]|nr:transporter [Clostridiales bacterium]
MEKRWKTLALALALSMLAVIFVSCAQEAPEVTGGEAAGTAGLAGAPEDEYYLITYATGMEYWYPVYAGFKEAGNHLGVKTFYAGSAEQDAAAEVQVFDETLAKNPKGIFLSPITAEAFKEPIDRAVAQGVAVVTFASDSPNSARQGYISSDNESAGQTAARAIGDELGGAGKVMVMRNPGQTNHDIRCNTFIKTIEAEYPGVEIVADEISNQDPDAAYTAVMTVAQRHPDLSAVFSPEVNSGIGSARAAKELGGAIKCICVGVNAEVLDMIKADEFWMALNPDQGVQGYMGMLMTFMIAEPDLFNPMNSKKAEGTNPTYIPFVDNGLNRITKENADSYYVDQYATSLGYEDIADMLSPGDPSAA